MVLEALLKSIRASEPTDKVVLVSNYTGDSTSIHTHTRTTAALACTAGRAAICWGASAVAMQYACSGGSSSNIAHADGPPVSVCLYMQRRWMCWV